MARGGRPAGSLGDRSRALLELFNRLEQDKLIDDAKVQVALYTAAIGGDVSAMKEYNDRRFGRPAQLVEHSGQVATFAIEPSRSLTPEAWLAAHAESQRAIADAEMGVSEGEPN